MNLLTALSYSIKTAANVQTTFAAITMGALGCRVVRNFNSMRGANSMAFGAALATYLAVHSFCEAFFKKQYSLNRVLLHQVDLDPYAKKLFAVIAAGTMYAVFNGVSTKIAFMINAAIIIGAFIADKNLPKEPLRPPIPKQSQTPPTVSMGESAKSERRDHLLPPQLEKSTLQQPNLESQLQPQLQPEPQLHLQFPPSQKELDLIEKEKELNEREEYLKDKENEVFENVQKFESFYLQMTGMMQLFAPNEFQVLTTFMESKNDEEAQRELQEKLLNNFMLQTGTNAEDLSQKLATNNPIPPEMSGESEGEKTITSSSSGSGANKVELEHLDVD